VKTERRGGDVFGGFVGRLLVIFETVEVLVSFGAFLAAVFLFLGDGVAETSVQRHGGTAWGGRRWGGCIGGRRCLRCR